MEPQYAIWGLLAVGGYLLGRWAKSSPGTKGPSEGLLSQVTASLTPRQTKPDREDDEWARLKERADDIVARLKEEKDREVEARKRELIRKIQEGLQ